MRKLLAGLLLACAALPARVLGHGANPSSELGPGVGKLRPGQFVWTPELAPSGLMAIVVDLATQRAHIYRDGVEIGIATISSGRRGYETPTGVFTILQKDKHHHSNRYDDAPMPYMQRLTWGGIALHGGHVPGYPASHGCVRLPMSFSETLFKETSTGNTTVIITEGSPSAEALAEHVAPLGNADFSWHPELSPTGPVTVLVSFKNQQVLILRDGVMIGRARMAIAGSVVGDPRALQIVASGQPGQFQSFHREAGLGQPPNADQLVQVSVPPEFLANLRAAATPGETMLIAEDAITGGDMPLTVMVSG